MGRLHLTPSRGKRTDAFGHSYLTTNPQVSSHLSQLARCRTRLGEPNRELAQTGFMIWEFPADAGSGAD